MADVATIEPLDRSLLEGMMIRWKLADEHLLLMPLGKLPAEQALRILIRHDVPMLLGELTRLRPELARGERTKVGPQPHLNE
jgi:hypothetical protein